MSKIHKGLLYAVILGTLAFQSSAESQDEVAPKTYKTKEGCICYLIYAPICGTDGRTYGNDCELKCAQRFNYYLMGVCKGECPCCKEPYHNDFPSPSPYPLPISDGGEGWGWNIIGMGSPMARWGMESMGMSFPYWTRGYSSPPSVSSLPKPVELKGQGSYMQVVSSKNGRVAEVEGSSPQVSSQGTIIVSSVSPSSPVQKTQGQVNTVAATAEKPEVALISQEKPKEIFLSEKYNEVEPLKEPEEGKLVSGAMNDEEMLEATD